MPPHEVNVAHLPTSHRRRLRWFQDRAGTTIPFPSPTADGFLVTRAKGIYKPQDSEYALSVRAMLSSPYADKAVERDPSGGWSLKYFQENPDPAQLTAEYTNRALLRCRDDRVPVGVLVQVSAKPSVQYDVIGLGLVTGWASGFFTLESTRLA